MKAFVFPGQGSQFPGMGKDLYESKSIIKELFEEANDLLGFNIANIMFNGSEEELKQTKVTQPAVFLHSMAVVKSYDQSRVEAVAGHSLGEITALVAGGSLYFKDGLRLVSERALAMQEACEINPSTMAAILGLEDTIVEEVCQSITDGIVVPANYNCPGQLVISGDIPSVEKACELLKEKGAKRALLLPVGGAFHSPLMQPAKERLSKAIDEVTFHKPSVPVYQNVDGKPYTDPNKIKENLLEQMTSPVRWTQTIQHMVKDSFNEYIELGPGKTLQGLIKKIDKTVDCFSAS